MRGSPILQSVIVSLVLAALAFFGSGLMAPPEPQGEVFSQPDTQATQPSNGQIVEVEIFFSDTPVKYMLMRPDENEVILANDGLMTNPALHEYSLRNSSDTTLWLDVTWSDESIGKRQFVQVVISVDDHEPQTFTFHDVTKVLKGTMEITLPNHS